MSHFDDYILANNMPFGAFPGTSTEYGIQEMAPGDDAEFIMLAYSSSFDQAVTIQAVGSLNNEPRNLPLLRDIGGSVTLAVGSTTQQHDSIHIVRADWPFSWYGLTLETGGTAPTVGVFNVMARIWKQHFAGNGASPELVQLMNQLSQGQMQMAQVLTDVSQVQKELRDMIAEILGGSGGHGHGPIGRLLQRGR